MKSPFKYIKVCAIPQPIGKIMEPDSEENKGIEFETALVYASPQLLALVKRIAGIHQCQDLNLSTYEYLVDTAKDLVSEIERGGK